MPVQPSSVQASFVGNDPSVNNSKVLSNLFPPSDCLREVAALTLVLTDLIWIVYEIGLKVLNVDQRSGGCSEE